MRATLHSRLWGSISGAVPRCRGARIAGSGPIPIWRSISGATPRCRGALRGCLAAATLVALAATGLACTAAGEIANSNNDVILRVEAMRLVSDPFGDVLTSSGTILDDTVEVDLSAILKAPIGIGEAVPAPALQDIALERYEVTFTRTDGGTTVPPGFVRGIAGAVRVREPGSEITATTIGAVVVPATTKAQPPISYLIVPGIEPGTNFTNIQVNARIQFFGKTFAGDPVTAVGNIGVNFADYGDANAGSPRQ